jgi:Na+/H+-translocating membrane pyrophosphatase
MCFVYVGNLDTSDKKSDHLLEQLLWSINRGIYVAGILFIAAAFGTCYVLTGNSGDGMWLRLSFCCLVGLLCGIFIGNFTE